MAKIYLDGRGNPVTLRRFAVKSTLVIEAEDKELAIMALQMMLDDYQQEHCVNDDIYGSDEIDNQTHTNRYGEVTVEEVPEEWEDEP